MNLLSCSDVLRFRVLTESVYLEGPLWTSSDWRRLQGLPSGPGLVPEGGGGNQGQGCEGLDPRSSLQERRARAGENDTSSLLGIRNLSLGNFVADDTSWDRERGGAARAEPRVVPLPFNGANARHHPRRGNYDFFHKNSYCHGMRRLGNFFFISHSFLHCRFSWLVFELVRIAVIVSAPGRPGPGQCDVLHWQREQRRARVGC